MTDPVDSSAPYILEDTPTLEGRNLDAAARALAHGELIAMQLATGGLLFDAIDPLGGVNTKAIQAICAAKQIDYAEAMRGKRPFVSLIPTDEAHRHSLIDFKSHSRAVRKALKGALDHLLTHDGRPLFYRVFANPDKPYLQPPVVNIEDSGKPSMVLLFLDNQYLRELERRVRIYKGGMECLLTGSSANTTGTKQQQRLEDIDPQVLRYTTTYVDLRDEHIVSIPAGTRDSFPIIDLTVTPPETIRKSEMYDAKPRHPHVTPKEFTTQHQPQRIWKNNHNK